MDTSSLQVDTLGTPYPMDAQRAVRHGARVALEVLRAPRLPERLILSADPIPGAAGTPRRDAPVSAHDATSITISYPAVVSPHYLGAPPFRRETVDDALAFCAGYATTQFVLASLDVDHTVSWVPRVTDVDPATRQALVDRLTYHVAAVASGFAMVAKEGVGDPHSEAVLFFLDRLREIVADEGRAALWRGALGQAVRACTQRVRFSGTAGKVATNGYALPSPHEIITLVQWADGQLEWPFPYPPARAR